MNIVIRKDNSVFSAEELAKEANAITRKKAFTAWDFNPDNPECRIKGVHCDCHGNGIFKLLPKDHPDVIEGGKRYIQCTICGGWSHL